MNESDTSAPTLKEIRAAREALGEPVRETSVWRRRGRRLGLAQGKIDRARTISDSLGAPHAAPYTFELCRREVDRLVKMDDDAMLLMLLMFDEAKLAIDSETARRTLAAGSDS